MGFFESFFEFLASGEGGPLFTLLLLPFLLAPVAFGFAGRWKALVLAVFSSAAAAVLCFTAGIAMHSWSGLFLVTLAPGIIVSALLGALLALPAALVARSAAMDQDRSCRK